MLLNLAKRAFKTKSKQCQSSYQSTISQTVFLSRVNRDPCCLYPGVILESSGDLGSGDSVFTDDDEDSFVLSDQAGMDDEDDEDEDEEDVNDEYLS